MNSTAACSSAQASGSFLSSSDLAPATFPGVLRVRLTMNNYTSRKALCQVSYLILLTACLRSEAQNSPDSAKANRQSNPKGAQANSEPKADPSHQSAEERIAYYTKWLMGFTGVLAGGTLALFGIALYQGRQLKATVVAMGRQEKIIAATLEEMRRAANAAGQSADVARDTLHLAHRAHLHLDTWSIENFRPNLVPIVQFDVLNRGRTAAELVGFRAAYDDTDPPPPAPEYGGEPPKPKHGLVRPSDRAVTVITYEFARPISEETFQAVASRTRPVYVWGEVLYKDIFGDEHRTGFGIELRIAHGAMGGWDSFPIDKPGYNYADQSQH